MNFYFHFSDQLLSWICCKNLAVCGRRGRRQFHFLKKKLWSSHFYTVRTSVSSSFLLFKRCSIPFIRRSQNRPRWIFQCLNFFCSGTVPLFDTSSNGYRMFGCTRVSMLCTNSSDAKPWCPSRYSCDVHFLELNTAIWMPWLGFHRIIQVLFTMAPSHDLDLAMICIPSLGPKSAYKARDWQTISSNDRVVTESPKSQLMA